MTGAIIDRRIALLLDVVDQAFDRKAWHGTALWGSVRGLTPREALWRPGQRRHNIWEIVLHTAYWKYILAPGATGRRSPRSLTRPRGGATSRSSESSIGCSGRSLLAFPRRGSTLQAGDPPGPTRSMSMASRHTISITPDRYSC